MLETKVLENGRTGYVVRVGNRGLSCGADLPLARRLLAALDAGFPMPSGGRYLRAELSKAGF